jgi:hypothetical protein
MMALKPVYLEWLDAGAPSEQGWHRRDVVERLSGCHMKTLGFIAKETKDFITIVSHCDENQSFEGLICIPRRAITKRRRVRL